MLSVIFNFFSLISGFTTPKEIVSDFEALVKWNLRFYRDFLISDARSTIQRE